MKLSARLIEKLHILVEQSDFGLLTDYEQQIKRGEEAILGMKMSGKTKDMASYRKQIDDLKAKAKALKDKIDREGKAQTTQDRLAGMHFFLDVSKKDNTLKALQDLTTQNNFYRSAVVKVWNAVHAGKKIEFKMDNYSTSYKGGILTAVIDGKEEQFTKKNIKVDDLKLYLPLNRTK